MNAALEELVDAIGLPAALKLVESYGGTRIYLPLPENVEPDNPVAQVIGVPATVKLAHLWAQERPYLPRAVDYLRKQRDAQLVRDAETMSRSELALKYRLTERHVYAILAACEDVKPAKQAGLF